MRRMRRGSVVPGLVLAAALVAAGCTTGGGGSSRALVIGASLPASGDFAQPGEATKRGYTIWQDMVNAGGGLLGRQVDLKVIDNGSSDKTVVSDYHRLITQDKVDLVLGTFSSLLNIPASAAAEKDGMTFVCPSCGSPNVFNRNLKKVFFAQQATASHQADLFAQYIAGLPEEDRPTRAAYPTQDDPFAKPVIDSVKQQLTTIGIQNVYSKVYPGDTTNFDGIAAEIKSRGAQLIVQGAVFEDGVGLVNSLNRAGYTPKVMFQTSAPSNGAGYIKGIGGNANADGMFYAVSWSPDTNYPLNQEFVQQYQAKFGGTPEEDAADAFAAAEVLQAAVEATGSVDQGKLADWLHNNKVQTILGPLSWDETGAPVSAFILAQWQSGQSKVVLPREVANTDSIIVDKPAWRGAPG